MQGENKDNTGYGEAEKTAADLRKEEPYTDRTYLCYPERQSPEPEQHMGSDEKTL